MACRWSWRSTPFPPTPLPRWSWFGRLRWRPAQWTRLCHATGWKAARARWSLAEAVVKAARTTQELQVPLSAGAVRSRQDRSHCPLIYGADGVDYSPEAEAKMELYHQARLCQTAHLCMAKTHLSFTADAAIKGAPVASASRSAICAPVWARASSIRWSAACAPCPACPPARCSSMSTWIWRQAKSSGLF